MVIALAGRRVDAPGAGPRFPGGNEELVRGRLDAAFSEIGARTLVCSAACGADLLALECAAARGMRRVAVLPFARDVFRDTSVTDRPGDWGIRYDRALADAEVVLLGYESGDDSAYAAANCKILDEAEAAACGDSVTAVIVWNGESRGEGDLTASFADEARKRGLRVTEVSTL